MPTLIILLMEGPIDEETLFADCWERTRPHTETTETQQHIINM